MQISFLIGPAGTGKTYRCLEEIRRELAHNPEGGPLIFLAPKQATYQLERQLLEGDEIQGYSRLQILSFERLARFVFETAGKARPELLSEQGRIMVLRALLNRHGERLCLFGAAAKRAGFSEELARQLREFTNHGLGPKQLRDLARQAAKRNALPEKLTDFALILEEYQHWLMAEGLQDSDALLGAATDCLEGARERFAGIEGVWVDGFAQLTPEERRLLVAIVGMAKKATLAFCLEPDKSARSPISPWFLVSQTLSKCKAEIETRYQTNVQIECLGREGTTTRFSGSTALRHLEANWSGFEARESSVVCGEALRIYECADPEAEAACCARAIVQFVRAGGRFREAAVLVRDFNNDYPHVLRSVFRRYEVPFFLDHRESVAHHPLAELTRGALRTIAFDWEQRDWLAVLKCGLLPGSAEEMDRIENEALARGWKGAVWRNGVTIPKEQALERDINRWRERTVTPFLTLRTSLQDKISGKKLAAALRQFWQELRVQEQLEQWASHTAEDAMHSTVWEQMNAWLGDVELAFADQELYLNQWIPILEAGLSSLSVGVIPPVLDEVLIGSVDRSRNPDLKLLCVPGVNEKVFPGTPGQEKLLTENDRTALLEAGSDLGHLPALKLAAEQFYGYIACTRARERLLISYSRSGLDGKALNPSRFVGQLERIFPDLKPVLWKFPEQIAEVVHRCELPMLGMVAEERRLTSPDPNEKLAPDVVSRLYGDALHVSVSALERFGSCPFRFFVERGLKVRERDELQLDVREQGSFQHEVLARFHTEATQNGGKWRDLKPMVARELIGRIADEEIAKFRDGLLVADEQNKFTAENYKIALQDFIEAVAASFDANSFDPERVEFAFGSKSGLPGWSVPLGAGHSVVIEGRVDRIDVFRDPDNPDATPLCVIMDYKSGLQEPNRTLTYHGIQQQLTVYLIAVTRVPEIAASLGLKKLEPAGCFLVPLRAQFEKVDTRRQIEPDKEKAAIAGYMHKGLFNCDHIKALDSEAAPCRSAQFKYSLTKNHKAHSRGFNALESGRFAQLLGRAEFLIREFGDRIYEGDIKVHPYKGGGQTACEKCHMLPICRFDSWTQDYNRLTPPPKISESK